MADVVQFKLERMLNELDDLEKRGFFSRQEIAEIVKQRRKFEYRLKRHSPLKSDFLAYIDYEKRLEDLRILRRNKMFTKKSKKSISDFSSVTRIIEIYRLAANRFKGDIQLWFQYLEFCRQRRNGRMKKALAEVIRFHPKVPGVWIYAAAWEFDNNLNVEAARALMQRGLRACPSSEDLWFEYLRMELTYLNKLKLRKVALGEDEGSLILDNREIEAKKWKDENTELFMTLKDDDKIEISEEKEDTLQENALKILKLVYLGAISTLPNSFGLRIRFLELLDATNLSHSEDIRKIILEDLKKDFSKDPSYYDWLANVESDQSKAIQVYEEGLKIIPSAELFKLYTKFLMNTLIQDLNNSNNLISHILLIYEKAENMDCITEELACEHVSFLLQVSKLDEAKVQVEKYCRGKFVNSVDLWALWINIETNKGKVDFSTVFELLGNVLKKVSVSEAEKLWVMALKLFSSQRKYFEKLVEISVNVLARDGGSDEGFSLSSVILNYVLQIHGVEKARKIYKRFIALPHPGLALYKACIELETNLACIENTRKLYESAVTDYDQVMSLWQDYYSMEVKMGTSETAAAVHWRARKVLKEHFTVQLSV